MKNEQFIENTPSSLADAYKLLDAKTPKELHDKYEKQDQILMKSNEWDYDNPSLVTNKIKNLLENIKDSGLTKEELKWKERILWFWYHHALSCAIFRHKDKERAKIFAEKALEIQDDQNRITKILYLLLNDKLEEAKEFAKTIPNKKLDDGNENPEPQTAQDLIKEYEEGLFFKE